MPSESPSARYRASALDRSLATSRIVCIVGPIRGLDEDLIVAKLNEATNRSDTPRIALVPGTGPTWEYRAADWVSVVTRRPDLLTGDVGELLNAVRNRTGDRQPLSVVICGDYLLVDYSHGLGDGRLGLALLATLGGGDVYSARVLAQGLSARAVGKALRCQFLAHPTRLLDMLQIRKLNKAGAVHDAGNTRRIDRWTEHRRTITAYLPPRAYAELRAWVKGRFEESSRASLTIALLMAALRDEGVRVDDQVSVLVDCRRYLDQQHQRGFGNFAVAVPILLPFNASPVDIVRRMRSVTASGWPVAVLAVAELKARLPWCHADVPATDSVEVPDRVRLSVSDLGKLTTFGHLDWVEPGPPQVAAYIDPDGADALTVLVDELAGGRTLSASFCDRMVDRAVVERALQRLCSDPVGVLSTAYGAS